MFEEHDSLEELNAVCRRSARCQGLLGVVSGIVPSLGIMLSAFALFGIPNRGIAMPKMD
jgi:hypothetical protein